MHIRPQYYCFYLAVRSFQSLNNILYTSHLIGRWTLSARNNDLRSIYGVWHGKQFTSILNQRDIFREIYSEPVGYPWVIRTLMHDHTFVVHHMLLHKVATNFRYLWLIEEGQMNSDAARQ